MTATAQTEPSVDVSFVAFEKMLETSEDPTLDTAYIFEFYPHEKIASVPVDATAFPARKSRIGVLVMARWDKEGEELAERTNVHREEMMVRNKEGLNQRWHQPSFMGAYCQYNDVISTG